MSAAPTGWLKANGASVSRTTYANLFNAITIQTPGNTTNGSNSVTSVGSTTGAAIGMPISGPGIPAGTTVTAFTANTITLSANATATANGVALVVAPFGVGDGSTTFNLPDLRGEFLRGLDDGRGVDTGRALGSYQADALQGHAHTMSAGSSGIGASSLYGNNVNPNGSTNGIISDGTNGTPRTAAETRPRNVAVLACIKF
ncbi:tail fiber protein [Chromobacterium haemolyticum]|nr:tail fiber protein [Chromobacterium haemolyticum]